MSRENCLREFGISEKVSKESLELGIIEQVLDNLADGEKSEFTASEISVIIDRDYFSINKIERVLKQSSGFYKKCGKWVKIPEDFEFLDRIMIGSEKISCDVAEESSGQMMFVFE